LYIHPSNRLEHLFAGLCAVLEKPPADPLAPEIIVVQNPGMARWLSQQIARQTGIAANFRFPLPATFTWELFSATLGELPDLSGYDRDVLIWRVLAELDQPGKDPAWDVIHGYLEDDDEGGRKFQLANKISDLLDQYLVYRPDMLLTWEQGREDHWQARLWRRLAADVPLHRAGLLQRFLQAADAGTLQTDTLPERVFFFGINSLAPSSLEVIARVSRLIDMHLFQLSPCSQAWDDIVPERLLAVKRKTWRSSGLADISPYFTSGNPLLASMGMVGQEFFSLLQNHDPQILELYERPDDDLLLGQVQADILELANRADTPAVLDPADRSIRFHCCHSPMREVQVLHDRLLDAFAADPELKPADILVMAPDINEYAPAVTGVFGSAEGTLHIPWSIADQSSRREQPVLEGFLGLLQLTTSRFTAPEVMALLENPAVRRKAGLDEAGLAQLREYVVQSGIRWGLDRQQRMETRLDDSSYHTWAFGLERMLLGYITGPLDEPLAGIIPTHGLPGDYAPWLGGLAAFLENLRRLHRTVQEPCKPDGWKTRLLQLVDIFFADDAPDQDGLLLLRGVINDFADNCAAAGFEGELTMQVVLGHLQQRLAEPAGGQAFLAGKVTFCNMVPMRSVPFKIIWLLGMNDTAYPRTQKSPAFDLIAEKPRLGDRSRRDDDRYLFLEALLSARRELSISWVGRDLQENTALPPSVVVAELRDYIDRGWQTGTDRMASEQLTVEYPLQPFSRRCFDGSPQTASYAAAWLPAAEEGRPHSFISGSLPAPEEEEIDFCRLVRFWNHPVRFFLEQRLGLRLRTDDELLEESEPFTLDHLQQYLLSTEIIARLQAGEDPGPLLVRKKAAGELPRGAVGNRLFQTIAARAEKLAQKIQPWLAEPREPVNFAVNVGPWRICGELDNLYAAGRVCFRPAALKGKDRLQLWLHHLLLCLVQPENTAQHSMHAAKDAMICLPPVKDPAALLLPFVEGYLLGLSRPLHFYPETSNAWAKAQKDSSRMNAARRKWFSGYKNRGEEEDPAYTLVLRGKDPLDQEFRELAALFLPVFDIEEACDAAP
jgi:exodeoxyribonuclease V gamma subunit